MSSRVLGPAVVTAYFTSAYFVNVEITDPYLDEIFHIPQAQKYCGGFFREWDASITTPPGLYIVSTVASWFTRTTCSVGNLRTLNALLGCIFFPWICRRIIRNLNRDRPDVARESTQEAFVISTFPLVFFFSLLYYTDVSSLCSVLLCYALGQERRYTSSAIAGLASLWFRQTNIVWVGFTAMSAGLDLLDRRIELQSARDERHLRYFIKESPQDRVQVMSLHRVVKAYLQAVLWEWRTLTFALSPYIPVAMAFIGFVAWNGGIVLGHQEMHIASRHYAQVPYFLAFSTLMGWPVLCDEGIWRALRRAMRFGIDTPTRALVSGSILVLMIVGIKRGTVVHPFLLADNRHYFFYVWRRIFGLHWSVRYALTPGYLVCLWLWTVKLGRTQSLPWMVAFFACTAAVLVPTPLVEPRYFMVPYIIIRLHATRTRQLGQRRWKSVEVAFNMIVNLVTLYVFLTIKFRWEGWEGWMRFMW